jgi:hypothetical protein
MASVASGPRNGRIERMNGVSKALREQQLAVARLLDSAWDPIGVYRDGDGPPPGEYESYAWQVLGHLQGGETAAEITALLREIKARMMDLGPGPEDAKAAEELVNWFRTVVR